MKQVIIRTRQFCALSREPKWQDWLEKNCPDLLDELLKHLSQSKGCKANTEKMLVLYEKLKSRKLQEAAISFLQKEFPIVVEEVGSVFVRGQKSKILQSIGSKDVFGYYNPNILTFPQKIVMQNCDREQLVKDVKAFIIPMINTDYLVIGEFAYVEYFKLKYSKEAGLIRNDSRELFKYRKVRNISQSENIVPEVEK